MVASDLFQGRKATLPIPREISEYLLLKEFPGYTLEGIRNLSVRDYKMLTTLVNLSNRLENEMQKRSMGPAGRSKGKTLQKPAGLVANKPITKGTRRQS